MSKTIKLKIVTPTQTVFDGEVQNFTAPGAVGRFQVLINHAPIVSKLMAGSFEYVQPNGTEVHYYVSGGFLELHQNSGTVLADSAELPSHINISEVENHILDLKRRYADHDLGMSNDQYHAELDAANARLAVARKG